LISICLPPVYVTHSDVLIYFCNLPASPPSKCLSPKFLSLSDQCVYL
jgi:hypothetical protein